MSSQSKPVVVNDETWWAEKSFPTSTVLWLGLAIILWTALKVNLHKVCDFQTASFSWARCYPECSMQGVHLEFAPPVVFNHSKIRFPSAGLDFKVWTWLLLWPAVGCVLCYVSKYSKSCRNVSPCLLPLKYFYSFPFLGLLPLSYTGVFEVGTNFSHGVSSRDVDPRSKEGSIHYIFFSHSAYYRVGTKLWNSDVNSS